MRRFFQNVQPNQSEMDTRNLPQKQIFIPYSNLKQSLAEQHQKKYWNVTAFLSMLLKIYKRLLLASILLLNGRVQKTFKERLQKERIQ